MDFSSFRTDSKKENEGVVVQVSPTSSIKIARLGSRRFRDAYKEKMMPYEAAQRANLMKDEDQERIVRELVAEHVIIGWEGFTEDGAPVQYSVANAIRLMQENREFETWVLEQSQNLDNFRPDKKQSEKN